MSTDGGLIELDGMQIRVIFDRDLTAAEREQLSVPPRGTACSCETCSYGNDADLSIPAGPICGCCRAD